MANIIPSNQGQSGGLAHGSPISSGALDRRTSRALTSLERSTLMEIASVRSDGLVAEAKMAEVDHLARTAMSGQAMLNHWAATLAGSDAFLADDLAFYTQMARMGKGQVIANVINDYSQQSIGGR